jgi:hypothetical protein
MAGKARNLYGCAFGQGLESSYLPIVTAALRRILHLLSTVLCLSLGSASMAQFYSGSQQEYGKNRVQYQDFLWQQYRFADMEVFFYKEGPRPGPLHRAGRHQAPEGTGEGYRLRPG